LKEIIESDPLWNKRFWNIQVTDASEHTMQIGVLAPSADSSKSWNLRCNIREKLIAYLKQEHPQCLPKLRAELGSPPASKEGNCAQLAPTSPPRDAGPTGAVG